jgi:hypothetical protein
MTAPDADRTRLLSRGFWAMMVLATVSFLAAATVVTLGSRHLGARPTPAARASPLAGGARDAKRARPDPSLGPP